MAFGSRHNRLISLCTQQNPYSRTRGTEIAAFAFSVGRMSRTAQGENAWASRVACQSEQLPQAWNSSPSAAKHISGSQHNILANASNHDENHYSGLWIDNIVAFYKLPRHPPIWATERVILLVSQSTAWNYFFCKISLRHTQQAEWLPFASVFTY